MASNNDLRDCESRGRVEFVQTTWNSKDGAIDGARCAKSRGAYNVTVLPHYRTKGKYVLSYEIVRK